MLTNVRFEDLKNIENVKTAVEHISLYVGLVVYRTGCQGRNLEVHLARPN